MRDKNEDRIIDLALRVVELEMNEGNEKEVLNIENKIWSMYKC